jgi:hypothetical protein
MPNISYQDEKMLNRLKQNIGLNRCISSIISFEEHPFNSNRVINSDLHQMLYEPTILKLLKRYFIVHTGNICELKVNEANVMSMDLIIDNNDLFISNQLTDNSEGIYFSFKVPGEAEDAGLYSILVKYINDELCDQLFKNYFEIKLLCFSKILVQNEELYMAFCIYQLPDIPLKNEKNRQYIINIFSEWFSNK